MTEPGGAPLSVYRMVDVADQILYVGCSVNAKDRWRSHRALNNMARELGASLDEVDAIYVNVGMPNERVAHDLEWAEIQYWQPPWNSMGLGGRDLRYRSPRQVALTLPRSLRTWVTEEAERLRVSPGRVVCESLLYGDTQWWTLAQQHGRMLPGPTQAELAAEPSTKLRCVVPRDIALHLSSDPCSLDELRHRLAMRMRLTYGGYRNPALDDLYPSRRWARGVPSSLRGQEPVDTLASLRALPTKEQGRTLAFRGRRTASVWFEANRYDLYDSSNPGRAWQPGPSRYWSDRRITWCFLNRYRYDRDPHPDTRCYLEEDGPGRPRWRTG